MSKAACVFAFLFAAACAMGGSPQGNDAGVHQDAKVYRDAHNVTGDGPASHIDAPIGPPPPDAFVPMDAPAGSGFCNDNTMCGTGTCCWVIACVPGTAVGTNLCLPQ